MEIVKEPSNLIKCPRCSCEFKFNKKDIYNATGGDRKGIPINPHKAVKCPFCDMSVAIWETDKKINQVKNQEYLIKNLEDKRFALYEDIKNCDMNANHQLRELLYRFADFTSDLIKVLNNL